MKYFITIKDEHGKEINIEVNAEIFNVFEDERKYNERRRNEIRHHYDKRGLEDYIIANETSNMYVKSIEDTYIDKEVIAKILNLCTPIQRRRFCLNKIYGYSCSEIAKLEGCTKSVIIKSIAAVMKKIEKQKNI